jgi:hypothetical protein
MRFPALFGAVFGAITLLTSDGITQSCTAALGATWSPASSTLSFTVNGAPANAPTMTFASLTQGTTTMHGITFGLGMPFYTMFFGIADGSGNLAASTTLASAPSGITVWFQSVSLAMNGMGGGMMGSGGMGGGGMGGSGPRAMTFCVSNVAMVRFP